jgi:hypothetical protein
MTGAYISSVGTKLNAKDSLYFMIFQALTGAGMKITVFWNVASCKLVETDRHFKRFLLSPSLPYEGIRHL